ncbi:MAG: transcriptional regulator [Rhodospirillales bacterium CG15_BIG_FIL_POST_REV_8_21_14_020_66_15]|nr:MAG: transcriptional regulator [Rhodospirillales bacterium CG15_BIG_FIL_POST_REV_8_21_14_020_66_15]
MTMSRDFKEHLLDLLATLGPVEARRMFGGGGLYLDGTMFALVADDVLYLKADDGNREDFEAAGVPPFTYQRRGKSVALGYFQAPEDILDDAEELSAWSRRAWEAARRSGAKAGKAETARKKGRSAA